MRKRLAEIILALFLVFLGVISSPASDLSASIQGWDYYYHNFPIKGYPRYNKLFNRYDFYDLDKSYCGSLVFNEVSQEWEFKGL